MVNCINLITEMSPRFVLGRENVPCVAEVVNRSLKADCTDFTSIYYHGIWLNPTRLILTASPVNMRLIQVCGMIDYDKMKQFPSVVLTDLARAR